MDLSQSFPRNSPIISIVITSLSVSMGCRPRWRSLLGITFFNLLSMTQNTLMIKSSIDMSCSRFRFVTKQGAQRHVIFQSSTENNLPIKIQMIETQEAQRTQRRPGDQPINTGNYWSCDRCPQAAGTRVA